MTQTWGTFSSQINVNELTEFVRHNPQKQLGFAQLCNPPTGGALGRNRGDTVQYTYYPDISNDGGEVTEDQDVPTSSITPIKATYTIKEYARALELTEKLDELSRLDTESDLMLALVKGLRRLENSEAYDQFNSTDWKVSPNATPSSSEFVTDGTLTAEAGSDLSRDVLRFVVKKARLNNIPFFDGESYVFITGIESMDELVYDDDVVTTLRYDSGKSAMNGEVGRVVNCRLITDNHKIAKAGSSSKPNMDDGFLVGADAVVHEVAMPPEIRAEDRDLGRKVKFGYVFLGCWQKMLDQTSHSREHIIKVGSA